MPRLELALASTLLVSACTEAVVARAPVVYPAQLPVRTFPSLIIAGGELPEGDLAERLEKHIEQDAQVEVRTVEVKELEPLREAEDIPPFSLVLLLSAGFYTDRGEQYAPMQYCDAFYGCYTDYYGYAAPRLVAQVDATVFEGPTARKLQEVSLYAWSDEPDSKEARGRLFEQLARKLELAVDTLRSAARVELEPVEQLPIVGLALEAIRKGNWPQGRDLLEQAALQLQGQRRHVQAKVWYDLALARLYAPGVAGLTQEAFEQAEKAFLKAIELDGSDRYEPMLERARDARERARILRDQRQAARLNFALKAARAAEKDAPATEVPPASDAAPPAP